MTKRKSYYLTTPIYYVNDVPHIGHAYTTVAADAMARWRRLRGFDVRFLTGTDEHGQKVQRSAEAQGITPQELADRVVPRFRDLWTLLGISHDDFIRTTEERHRSVVQRIFQVMRDKGDIYLDDYEDWYCTPCETFFTATQLVNGLCPDCGRPVERVKERSYFFRMSKYQQPLLDHIRAHPDFILPATRRNEILSFVEGGLRDLSVSRTTFSWGIPVPGDPEHVIYVWIDALTNYISALGAFGDDPLFARYWPADLHLIGKDILRFHAVYWPTMLMSAGLPLPKRVFAHGWWTVDGQKMSKSLGNVVDPYAMAAEFGPDAFRYFLLREVPFGLDGDFSRQAMRQRINSDLANDFGNLASRILTMAGKFSAGRYPPAGKTDEEIAAAAVTAWRHMAADMDDTAFHLALTHVWAFVGRVNKYIDEVKPWEVAKDPSGAERLAGIMATLLAALRAMAVMAWPFMPDKTERLWQALGHGETLAATRLPDDLGWPGFSAGQAVQAVPHLFPRLEERT